MANMKPHFALVTTLPGIDSGLISSWRRKLSLPSWTVYVYGRSHGHDPFGVNNSSNQCTLVLCAPRAGLTCLRAIGLAGGLFRSDWDFAIAAGKSVCVDLEDVAKAHVLAVQREEANGKRLVLVR
jgi:hypothetical protein